MRSVALTLAGVLGVTALGLMALSLYWADLLADWRLPGAAALAAIACNVMLMVADRAKDRLGAPPGALRLVSPPTPPRRRCSS